MRPALAAREAPLGAQRTTRAESGGTQRMPIQPSKRNGHLGPPPLSAGRRANGGRQRAESVRNASIEMAGFESSFHHSLLGPAHLASARSDVRRQYHSHYVWMALTDALAVFLALLLAYQLRFDRLVPTLDFWLLLLTVPLITPVIYLTMRLYRVHQYSTAEEFRRLIVGISLIISATVMVSFWSKAPFSRLWMLLSWGLGLILATSVRRLWHWRVRRVRLDGKLTF